MASTPLTRLVFGEAEACPDCGERVVQLPSPLPRVPDDIDMRARDYDDLRRFMLEDLAARRPERTRWTPADLDVVLVEAVATVLDELSDLADRASAESYLETARRPASVRWLLELIGADPVRDALATDLLPVSEEVFDAAPDREGARAAVSAHLDRYWLHHPEAMEQARRDGPRQLRQQERMVTVADYAQRCEDHPLVDRATAWSTWSGSWQQVRIAVIGHRNRRLDDQSTAPAQRWSATLHLDLRTEVEEFHDRFELPDPPWLLDVPAAPLPHPEDALTLRSMLQPYLERLRMIGTEAVLVDAVQVPLTIALSIQVADNYFRSEVEAALRAELGSGPGGLFRSAVLRFGHDVFASNIMERAFAVAGVADVCLNRFKRRGDAFPDRSAAGVIVLDDLEVPVLGAGDSGLRLTVHGGRPG